MFGRKKDLLILIFFVVFTIILFRQYVFQNKVPFPGNLLVSFYQPWATYQWDGYENGPPAKPIGFDTARMFYPLRSLVTEALKQGHLPLWNPYSFSGNTILGAYQSAVFHPMSFLFLLLPQIDAWSITIVLAPILAAFTMYVFLRDLSLSRKAALFGAMIFAFAGMMIVWWEEMFMSVYSFLPLPVTLFAILRLFVTKRFYYFIVLVLSIVFSIASGYFQTTFYLLLMAVAWTCFLLLKYKKNGLIPLCLIILAGVAACLLSGIQLIPAIEAYRLSARGGTDVRTMFEEFFIPLSHLFTFIAPDYYGNSATHNFYGSSFYHEKVIWITIPGLFFALLGAITSRKDNIALFFVSAGILFLSLAFSLPTSWFLLYQLHIPFLSEMTPSRIVYLSTFCFAVLSAIGIERFLTTRYKKTLILVSLVILVIFILAWIPAFKRYSGITMHDKVPLRNLIIPTIIYLATIFSLLHKRFINVAYCAIVLLTVISIGYFCNKYLYFSKRSYVYPTTPLIQQLQTITGINRYSSIGEAYIDRNFSQFLRLYSPEGYESFNIERYSQLIMSSHTQGRFPEQLNRADASLYPAKNLQELADNPYTLRIMSLLGIRYLVTRHDESSSIFTRVWTDTLFDIYEYQSALPRFFLASAYVVETEPQKILDYIYDSTHDLSRMIVLEQTLNASLEPIDSSDVVVLNSYKSEQISFTVSTAHQTMLFLSDNYYPGWVARINGKETPIYRANYSFRAVVVPAGNHLVTFSYEPRSVELGYYSLLLGLGILFCISIVMIR